MTTLLTMAESHLHENRSAADLLARQDVRKDLRKDL